MRIALVLLLLFLFALAIPARAVDLTTWPLRADDGTQTVETADGFSLQPSSSGTPFGFTLEASTATDGSGGSDTKVGPIRWMAPERIQGIRATGGFGFPDGSRELLRLNASAGADGFRMSLEVLGDRLGAHPVSVVAYENGNPVHEEAATEASSVLFEGSAAPSGTGALGTPLGSTFDRISDEIEQTRPQTADRPGGGAIALLFPSGTTLTFGDVVVTADEVRVGIWGTTGTLFDVEDLSVEFTPDADAQPRIQVIDAAMGLNGHEVRVGNGGRGEIVRAANGRAALALRPAPDGRVSLSTVLRPDQRGVTLSLTDESGNALAVPPILTHQGRVLGAVGARDDGRRTEIVYGVRATPTGDRTDYEPILNGTSAQYTVRWTTSTGATGSSEPSDEFPATSSDGAWPSEWTLPPMRDGNDVGVVMRFDTPTELTVGSTRVQGALQMEIEMLMTLAADPLLAGPDTDLSGLPPDAVVFAEYTENVFGPGSSTGAPTAGATGDAVIERAADGTVLARALAPTGGDPRDGVEFTFDPVDAAEADFVTSDGEPAMAFRCGGVRASDPTQPYAPIEVLLEPLGGGEYGVRFDARAITALEEIDYEVLDGEGNRVEGGKIVHRDLATRLVGTPLSGSVEGVGGDVVLGVKLGRVDLARSATVDREVRVIVPQSDFRIRTLQVAGDGGAVFVSGRALRTTTDVPSVAIGPTLLHRPFPNPFNPRTSVRFDLAQPAEVLLGVYDARGRVVDVLVDERLDAGSFTRVWDGTDLSGRPVASGMYFLRLAAGSGTTAVRRVMLVR